MMKGLLLKEWYGIKSYFRAFLLMYLIFAVVSCMGNSFFLYYPCILSGMIALSLISYEEKEKWNVFAATLPYSRAQLVSSKYLVSLILSGIAILGMTAAQAGAMCVRHCFDGLGLLKIATMLVPMSLLPTALLLPFIYRFGVEKGRIVYYLVLSVFVSALVIVTAFSEIANADAPGIGTEALICLISFGLFFLSWYLSIRFYEKREIR